MRVWVNVDVGVSGWRACACECVNVAGGRVDGAAGWWNGRDCRANRLLLLCIRSSVCTIHCPRLEEEAAEHCMCQHPSIVSCQSLRPVWDMLTRKNKVERASSDDASAAAADYEGQKPEKCIAAIAHNENRLECAARTG